MMMHEAYIGMKTGKEELDQALDSSVIAHDLCHSTESAFGVFCSDGVFPTSGLHQKIPTHEAYAAHSLTDAMAASWASAL